jgi:CRISPR-associated endonuclease Csn1
VKIFSLDVGTASIGQSIYIDSKPIKSFVHMWNSGVAKGKSDASNRFIKRSQRVQRKRKKARKTALINQLVGSGLLIDKSQLLKSCDHSIYELYKKGINGKLTHIEIGRIFYHINQRRGYLSNKKIGDDKDGIVKNSINEINEKKGTLTYGQHASELIQRGEKVRGNYTSREMHIEEFYKIINKQIQFYPFLKQYRKKIYNSIFYQRPLKSCKNLIGKDNINNKKCDYTLSLYFQKYRILQFINNLKINGENSQKACPK